MVPFHRPRSGQINIGSTIGLMVSLRLSSVGIDAALTFIYFFPSGFSRSRHIDSLLYLICFAVCLLCRNYGLVRLTVCSNKILAFLLLLFLAFFYYFSFDVLFFVFSFYSLFWFPFFLFFVFVCVRVVSAAVQSFCLFLFFGRLVLFSTFLYEILYLEIFSDLLYTIISNKSMNKYRLA